MYYLGALTQDALPSGKHTGTVFRIPSKLIHSEYIAALKERLGIDNSFTEESQIAITTLLKEKDIRELCNLAEMHFQSLKGNAVKFQDEKDVQSLFVYAFQFYYKKVIGETEFEFYDRNRKKRYADLLYQPDDAVHIEFKNVKTNHMVIDNMILDNNNSWEKGYIMNNKIEAMNDDELKNVKVREPFSNFKIFPADSSGNYLERNNKTTYFSLLVVFN